MMADPLPSYSPHVSKASGRGLPLVLSSQPVVTAGARHNNIYSLPPPPPELLQPSSQMPFQLQHNSQISVPQHHSQPPSCYSSTSSGSSAFSTTPSSYTFASPADYSHGSPSYTGSPISHSGSPHHSQPFSLPPLRLHRQSPSPTAQHVQHVSGAVQSYYQPPPQQQQQGYSPTSINLPPQPPAPPTQMQPVPAQVAAAAAAVALHQHAHSSQVAAAQVAATIADVTAHKPAKEIKRRTKTGCLTCRKRRIKCDERHPICFNCSKSKRVCLGYDPVFKAQRADKRDDKESSKSENESSQQLQGEVKRIKIDSLLAE
ncbi:uncharacterized protein V1513DRAFT_436796 [Lipomyces chichibuensis]|uniref:uncharacterized protein n=1 Tax=Lipomyces chichibuensis TaxID=1546026 RepID=UPI003343A6BF